MTDNLHTARVEAATNVLVGSTAFYCALDMTPDELREDARDVLAAADAVVTVEKIADEIAGHPIGSGYYQTTISIYEAQEIAAGIHALLTGEEESND